MLISHKIYSEPMRLLETPRSLSVYIYTCTNQCYFIKSSTCSKKHNFPRIKQAPNRDKLKINY